MTTQIDISLFHLFNQTLTAPWLDSLMRGITLLGEKTRWLLLATPLLFLFPNKRLRWMVFLVAVSTLVVDWGCTALIKPLFARARPFAVLEGVRLLSGTERLSVFSFPSNHAANMFTAATLISFFYPRRWVVVVTFAIALFVAYSRVYVGVHYPFDVAGGAILGLLTGWAVYRLWRRYEA